VLRQRPRTNLRVSTGTFSYQEIPMSDIMRPVPFDGLLARIFGEYKASRSIFDISENQFYRKGDDRLIKVFGETCETPVGPAAGPHTQLAQNIVASWLTGGRFIELKTVQIMDRLEIAKPCIDAEDECYNTEWSTEYTLPKAFDEYLKAWFALHLLEEVFDPRLDGKANSFSFNMSVGYDLEGIKQPPMQEFIDSMVDARRHPKFAEYVRTLEKWVNDEAFIKDLGLEDRREHLKYLPGRISSKLVRGVTLSTMHGCPPHEIEAICQYMLEEKSLNTFVKLNPTLLGFDRVREILDACGFDYLKVKPESFAHDLQLDQAKSMLRRLLEISRDKGLSFGVKLTNTLGAVNGKGTLPGEEFYMSGRALFPLSINVAAILSREFDGELPVSYSGGASLFNIRDIFETGIRPITMATDLLKPGGYLRLLECVKALDRSDTWQMGRIDVARLEALAAKAVSAEYAQKSWRSKEVIDTGGPLPLTDCYVAPCVSACAIHQDIPEYIHLLSEERYADALDVIYQKNALPAITGHICDHQCQANCTRLDYDGPLKIRDLKKVALEKGWAEYRGRWHKPAGSGSRHPVAVVGMGPAGLSAGYFLARAGHPVTLIEREASAGGVCGQIVPRFRLPEELVRHDIDFIAEHGVKFEYGCDPELTVDQLKARGFEYVLIGIGADKNSGVKLEGSHQNVFKSLSFLRRFNSGEKLDLGQHVAVVGAGNTAMDCARAALRVPGVKDVTVVYRRSFNEIPAHREEYEEAIEDGVQFRFLIHPERFDADGSLTCRMMELGAPDEMGRRRPLATDQTVSFKMDALITAVGEQADTDVLKAMGVPLDDAGWPLVDLKTGETSRSNVFLIGDVQRGPSSIVGAIGDARRATDVILKRESLKSHHGDKYWLNADPAEITARKGAVVVNIVKKDELQAFVKQEGERCLQCNYVCNKCVDVCPNRANIAIAVPGFKDRFQILHVDAYCNECGNCASFCPWQGRPYKDKVTIFSLRQDFDSSTNAGFLVEGSAVRVRQEGKCYDLSIDAASRIDGAPPELSDLCRIITQVHAQHGYLLSPVAE
jgi:putative selenate reductase